EQEYVMWIDEIEGITLSETQATFDGIEEYLIHLRGRIKDSYWCAEYVEPSLNSLVIAYERSPRWALTPLNLIRPQCSGSKPSIPANRLNNAVFDGFCVFHWRCFEADGSPEHALIIQNKKMLLACILVHPDFGRKAFNTY